MEVTDETTLAEAVRALRAEVAHLAERIAALETADGRRTAVEPSAVAPAPPTGTDTGAGAVAPVAEPRPAVEEIDEEILLVISAAIAAFCGKKPFIRQIRLISSSAWAQQGRLGIQASHALARYSRPGALK